MESSSLLFTCVETRGNHLWCFPNVFNARIRGGILELNGSSCGNSLKPLVMVPPSPQCRESRKNRRIECFQVWNHCVNHIGNYGDAIDFTNPSGFQQVYFFGKPIFFT